MDSMLYNKLCGKLVIIMEMDIIGIIEKDMMKKKRVLQVCYRDDGSRRGDLGATCAQHQVFLILRDIK